MPGFRGRTRARTNCAWHAGVSITSTGTRNRQLTVRTRILNRNTKLYSSSTSNQTIGTPFRNRTRPTRWNRLERQLHSRRCLLKRSSRNASCSKRSKTWITPRNNRTSRKGSQTRLWRKRINITSLIRNGNSTRGRLGWPVWSARSRVKGRFAVTRRRSKPRSSKSNPNHRKWWK